MGRFYFHLREGSQLIPDDEGWDYPDLSAARCEAIRTARELLVEAIRAEKQTVTDAIVIADQDGQSLETIPLSLVLPKSLKG